MTGREYLVNVIFAWVLPKVDPESRTWLQTAHLGVGPGKKEGRFRESEAGRVNKGCAISITAVGMGTRLH